MTFTPTIIEPTGEQIEAAILAIVNRQPDGELVRWTTIRRRVPGTFWAKQEALLKLYDRWELNLMKIHGSPYVIKAEEVEQQLAVKFKGQPRIPRVI
jgi:hypothetical protein